MELRNQGRTVVFYKRATQTNLPREVMGFRAYPFVACGNPERDPRRFGSEVSHVGLGEGRKWSVRSKIGNGGHGYDEVYDAMAVCNGQCVEPWVADIPGNEIEQCECVARETSISRRLSSTWGTWASRLPWALGSVGANDTIFMHGLPGLNYLVGEVNGVGRSRGLRVPGRSSR
ncbi:Flavin-containing monooxygenase FMO GS-OX4 [Striga hermonthica]|uniref:Flavin-containing monooxygenase FMO GS-OX4 n=1 Tax=Striga hermonthica TaxID=68872 RepID=A0A9N7P084_STRHE|nr:Flavin-containing monooxygenase FMO GS-OX4 [Striga hermonthica]